MRLWQVSTDLVGLSADNPRDRYPQHPKSEETQR